MHPREISPREAIINQLESREVLSPTEECREILDKYSKVNDGRSFKSKFYGILNEQVHKEHKTGKFMNRRR